MASAAESHVKQKVCQGSAEVANLTKCFMNMLSSV